jgi:hypothetical protein
MQKELPRPTLPHNSCFRHPLTPFLTPCTADSHVIVGRSFLHNFRLGQYKSRCRPSPTSSREVGCSNTHPGELPHHPHPTLTQPSTHFTQLDQSTLSSSCHLLPFSTGRRNRFRLTGGAAQMGPATVILFWPRITPTATGDDSGPAALKRKWICYI